METHDAFTLLDEIDRVMADRVLVSVVPDVFTILDDANAGRREIELMGAKLSPELRLRLQAMANSVYMGNLRRGNVESFYDAVNCLGMHRTKAFLIALASSRIVPLDPAVAVVFARSYATSVMAHIFALQAGFREEGAAQAELCGLFLDVGRTTLLLYRCLPEPHGTIPDEAFIDAYHPYLGAMIVERWGMPEYVKEAILAADVILDEQHLTIAGVAQLAHDTVWSSFRRHGNRLVLRCRVPRPATDVTRTLEAIVTEKFRAAGLEEYLHIIRVPRLGGSS